MGGVDWRISRAALALALAIAAVMPAAAQDAPAPSETGQASDVAAEATTETGALPDIIVTAQRRRESAQSVPIAVTAFSAESLEAKNIQSTLQITQYVPNLFGSNNTGLGSANAYYLRGLGNTESIATFDPAVGTYIDDIYLSRQNANNFSFFDVERVEVLRGPQGTLFGRNTTGGAVNVILKRPGDTIAGYGEFSYGAFKRKLGRLSFDLPLTPAFAVKLSGYFQDGAGYVRNTTTGERLNDDDGAGARLAVRWEIAPAFSWNASVAYIRADGENLLNFDCDPRAPTRCDGRFASTGLNGATRSYAPLVISGRKAEFGLGNRSETVITTSNFEWASEAATLNVITGYVDLKQRFSLDFADGRGLPNIGTPVPVVRGFPLGGFTILNDGTHRQFSQEVKLSGSLFGGLLDYVTGFYLLDEKNKTDFADVFTIFTGATVPLLLADRTLDNDARSTAGYAQGDLNLGEFKLTAGVRYTDETKTLRFGDNRPQCGGSLAANCLNQSNLVAQNGTPIPTRQRTKQWTPRFAVNWAPDDALLLYASATRGFKSGGWNVRGYNAFELLPFGPETVWSYEAGFKSEWFDKRLRVNATAFRLDAEDLQTPSAFIRADNSAAFITQNFADYRNQGVEVEVTAVPIDDLNIYVNFGFQDDAYRVDRNAPTRNIYGVTSVATQQAACLAQLAAGQVPLSTSSAPAGQAPNNAPACAAGIVTASGDIATPVRTPSVSLAVGGTYDWKLPAAGIILTPSVNVIYRSAYETGTANATLYTGSITAGAGGGDRVFPANPFDGDVITGSRSDAYVLVNGGLAMRTDDGNWTLALECFNCLDRTVAESSLVNATYLNPPRTWQVRLKRVL